MGPLQLKIIADKVRKQLKDSKHETHIDDIQKVGEQLQQVFFAIIVKPLDLVLSQVLGTTSGTMIALLPYLDIANVLEPLFMGDLSVLLPGSPGLWDLLPTLEEDLGKPD